MRSLSTNKISKVSFVFAMLAFSLYNCRQPVKNSSREPASVLQERFELDGSEHPEILPLVFSELALVGDFSKDGEHTLVFFNQLAKKVIYYQPSTQSVTQQFILPDSTLSKWPFTNFKVVGTDSLLYFNCNNQRISLLHNNQIVASYPVPAPTPNEPNSTHTFGSIQAPSVNNWLGLKAYANFNEGNNNASDSLISHQNAYSFFNIDSGELQDKSYPVQAFSHLPNEKFNIFITHNTSLNRIDYYYTFSDTIKSYYPETKKLETHTISNSSFPNSFLGIGESSVTSIILYDSNNQCYVRKITKSTLSNKVVTNRSVYLELLNHQFEVMHSELMVTGNEVTSLTQLNDGVYFGKLALHEKKWAYQRVNYTSH